MLDKERERGESEMLDKVRERGNERYWIKRGRGVRERKKKDENLTAHQRIF